MQVSAGRSFAKTNCISGIVVGQCAPQAHANMLSFFTGIVAALLPERFRSRSMLAFASPGSAVASGAIESLTCLTVLIVRYFAFANARLGGVSTHTTLKAAETGGETAVMGLGIFILVAYAIQPVTLLLIYFAVEGIARGAAALVSGEVVPSLPLQLLAMAATRAKAAQRERELGPPVEDLVQPGSGDFALVIATCRPKPWNQMTTISYQNQFYELVREESSQPPRRWVYVLRKRHEGKVVRGGIYQYSPDEAMPKTEEASTTP